MVSAEEVVLSSDGKRPDGVLDPDVVDVILSVKDISAQPRQKGVCVHYRSAHPGFRAEESGHGVHPCLEVTDYRIGIFLPALLHSIGIQPLILHA